jgi:hypothetical protein
MTRLTLWIVDPGHAWLQVPASKARKVAGISTFSYLSPDGNTAYLEHDCDAALYLNHYGIDGQTLDTKTLNGDAPCRNYPAYRNVEVSA